MSDEFQTLVERFRRIATRQDATAETLRLAQATGGRLVQRAIRAGRFSLSDDARLSYQTVAPFQATDSRLREIQLSLLWQLALADVLPVDERHPNEIGNTQDEAEQNAVAAERLRSALTATPAEQIKAAGDVTPAEPKVYLVNWKEVLTTLKLTADKKDWIVKANERYEGPIVLARQGGQPFCDQRELLKWHAGLAARISELHQRRRDKQATVAVQHNYGETGTVVVEIGAVKKRRKDAKP